MLRPTFTGKIRADDNMQPAAPQARRLTLYAFGLASLTGGVGRWHYKSLICCKMRFSEIG